MINEVKIIPNTIEVFAMVGDECTEYDIIGWEVGPRIFARPVLPQGAVDGPIMLVALRGEDRIRTVGEGKVVVIANHGEADDGPCPICGGHDDA